MTTPALTTGPLQLPDPSNSHERGEMGRDGERVGKERGYSADKTFYMVCNHCFCSLVRFQSFHEEIVVPIGVAEGWFEQLGIGFVTPAAVHF